MPEIDYRDAGPVVQSIVGLIGCFDEKIRLTPLEGSEVES